ncbi:regulator of G-protein signaling 8-like [Daphnia pulicaria]|uniref:regulator of G-protein signaling 8-like n=1 Tax=Daphnia pulicaria TaxID=35523 RepID=UPI001EE9B917|nr:regulator of G-protein signaling 8-like [Daphnia pulicaria]
MTNSPEHDSGNKVKLVLAHSLNTIVIVIPTTKRNLVHNVKERIVTKLSNKRSSSCSSSDMRLQNLKSNIRRSLSPSSARPQPEEAQKWAESFTKLMASKYGSSLYRAFLLREFSNENLDFWMAVEEYKNSKPQKMAAKAQQIYNDFVAVKATKQVNLDAETRILTLANIQSDIADQFAFDRAQRRTQHMMERDSYLRFLQSELFLELAHPERYY